MPEEPQEQKPKSTESRTPEYWRDEVGRTGVYPMSGPLPKGDAPLRGQMEFGQGERGAAGYYDSGESELVYSGGQLLGASGPGSVASPAPTQAAGSEPAPSKVQDADPQPSGAETSAIAEVPHGNLPAVVSRSKPAA